MKRFANTICATAGSKAMTIIVVRTAKGLAKQISLTSLASAAIPGALGICTKVLTLWAQREGHASRRAHGIFGEQPENKGEGSWVLAFIHTTSLRKSLVIPRNVPPPVAVSVTIAIIIVLSIIIVDAPPPVSIVFTMICALNSICLRDHAQLLADL